MKKLTQSERQQVVESALATPDVDNEPFFRRMRQRLDRCGRTGQFVYGTPIDQNACVRVNSYFATIAMPNTTRSPSPAACGSASTGAAAQGLHGHAFGQLSNTSSLRGRLSSYCCSRTCRWRLCNLLLSVRDLIHAPDLRMMRQKHQLL